MSQGMNQTIIPAFPPNTQVSFSFVPRGEEYAHINYLGIVGPTVVPDAFYVEIIQYGGRTWGGTLSPTMVGGWGALESYLISSRAAPTTWRMVNRSNLVQYFEGLGYYLVVPSSEDLGLVSTALERLVAQSRAADLQAQANSLLTQVLRALGLRRP